MTLMSVLSEQVKSLVGFTFVNDTDNFQNAPCPWSNAQTVISKTCQGLLTWNGTLEATGGCLEIEKSFWYLLDYSFRDDVWHYKSKQELEGELIITTSSSNKATISRLDPNKARETLGVHISMDGSWDNQVSKLMKKTSETCQGFAQTHALPSKAWSIFKITISKTWDYPKEVMDLSRNEWEKIARLILPTVLQKTQIAKTFP